MPYFRWVKIISRKKFRYLERHPMKLLKWMMTFIIGFFFFVVALTNSYDWKEAGYTAFGSLFTALAFAGMIVTVLLQRAELQEQRKELRAQRRELEGQKRELEIQNRTAQLQRFENSFFHLLEGFKQTVEAVKKKEVHSQFSIKQVSITKYFDEYYSYFSSFGLRLRDTAFDYIKDTLQTMPSITKTFCLEYYCIIDFMVNHDVFKNNDEELFKYIKILNAILTNSEYRILFYYAIANKKIDIVNKCKIFTQYSLKNSTSTPCEPWHILFFEPSAFGPDYEEYIKTSNLKGKTLADFLPQEQTENS